MIDPIFQGTNYQAASRLLDAAVLRHEAIATNIANAETPGYRRLDVQPDFSAQLAARLKDGSLQRGGATDLKPTLVADVTARSARPDGNTVEIERELLELNRNNVAYEFLTDVVSNNFKQLKLAITGRAA